MFNNVCNTMKNIDLKEQLDNIADFVRDEYSMHGVEISAQGAKSITVRLPEDLPLTALCADLWNTFEAPVELKPGPLLTIYAYDSSSKKASKQDQQYYHVRRRGSSRMSSVLWLLLWIGSTIVGACMLPFLEQTAAYKRFASYANVSL